MSFFRHFTKSLIITLLSLLFSVLILVGGLYFYAAIRLPDVETLKDYRLQIPLRIYTNSGDLIGEYGAMRRDPVALNQVPKLLVQAVIDTEDQRFFAHSGVDFIGIIRAARELVITGQRNQGASTITMQVARNFFLTPEKTFGRKINEILLALKINSMFSKEKILELYLNKIYLGQHAYGVSAASEIYYGKSLNELTLAEMAMIAGLPQAPSKENPITNPEAAKIRRNHVLQRMLEAGHIDQKTYQEAIKAPADAYYHGPKITVDAPHVAEMVRNVIYQQFGDQGYTTGLQVYTTIDSTLQQEADIALRDGLIAYERRHMGFRKPERNLGLPQKNLAAWQDVVGSISSAAGIMPAVVVGRGNDSFTALLGNGTTVTIPATGMAWTRRANIKQLVKPGDIIRVIQKKTGWELTQLPRVAGALVALNPDTGAVLALNGGFNRSDNGYNRVIQALRQPGSSFKPFIYAAALAKGYTLSTIINDAPIAINDTGDPNNLWRPQNDDNQFRGPTRLRLGLIKSINVMTVRLLQQIGIPYALDYLTHFGFSRNELPASLSLALGAATLTPMQMANAYAVFANGGYLVTPYFIDQIKSAEGKIIYKANPMVVPPSPGEVVPAVDITGKVEPTSAPAPTQTIDTDIAYLITSALQDVIQHGTGYAATALKRADVAGKTGTTNRQVDAWFSGYTRRLVTTVWVGYDQPKPLYEHGAQAALPIWIEFMRAALAGKPEESLPPPPDIVSVRIDPETGTLADPDQEDAIFEVYKANTAPTESTDNYSDGGDSQEGTNPEAQLF